MYTWKTTEGWWALGIYLAGLTSRRKKGKKGEEERGGGYDGIDRNGLINLLGHNAIYRYTSIRRKQSLAISYSLTLSLMLESHTCHDMYHVHHLYNQAGQLRFTKCSLRPQTTSSAIQPTCPNTSRNTTLSIQTPSISVKNVNDT